MGGRLGICGFRDLGVSGVYGVGFRASFPLYENPHPSVILDIPIVVY